MINSIWLIGGNIQRDSSPFSPLLTPLIAHVIDEALQASPVFYSTRNSKLCASKCWSVFFVTLVRISFCSFVCQLTYKLVRLDLHVFALQRSCFSSAVVVVESQSNILALAPSRRDLKSEIWLRIAEMKLKHFILKWGYCFCWLKVSTIESCVFHGSHVHTSNVTIYVRFGQ